MGKSKKFIDKKKATTYRLFARDTSNSTSSKPETDRVFVRVDNNSALTESIFADASENSESDDTVDASLPDYRRKEILTLGFPDDGYNYLLHLREIKNSGAASTYFQNPKADLSIVPNDIKAYDASSVAVAQLKNNEDDNDSIFETSKSTKNIKVEKVMDPDVLALLYNSDSSICGSEADELEEDFIIQANLPILSNGSPLKDDLDLLESKTEKGLLDTSSNTYVSSIPRRPLDEQFDLLEHQEYESDEEEEDYRAEEEETLAKKVGDVLIKDEMSNMEEGESYTAPEDIVQRCAEYGKKYEEESEVGELVMVEESGEESEEWDCETIVSTYSNVENHPGRIGRPVGVGGRRKIGEGVGGVGGRRIGEAVGCLASGMGVGPKSEKRGPVMGKKKVVGMETKEEKRERKAALKEEKREGRRMKKEVKTLYKGESQMAQRAAALCCPTSIHLF